MSKAEFVRLVTADQPAAPAYFGYDADLNRRVRPTLDPSIAASLRTLTLDETLALAGEGAVLLDVRSAAEFGGGHLAGSVNVGLDGRFAQWAGSVVDPRTRVVVVAAPGRAEEAALRLGRVGFDRVVGRLDDLAGALGARPDLARRMPKASAVDLVRHEATGTAPVVIDVRAASEWTAGHVEGSVNLPLPASSRASKTCPATARCSSTARAATARRSRRPSSPARDSRTSPTSSGDGPRTKRPALPRFRSSDRWTLPPP